MINEYKSISLLRTPPVFSYTDNDPGGYGGTRRMIGGQTFYWEETSAKVNAGEITTSDWEGKRTADDFKDTYGEPGFAYMADTDGGFMYYATETDGQYLRIGIDSNGLIREIGQETTAGVTRLRKVSLQPNTNENA